jgi:hypothetical protein
MVKVWYEDFVHCLHENDIVKILYLCEVRILNGKIHSNHTATVRSINA